MRLVLVTCLLALMHTAHAGTLSAETIGEAYDQDSDRLLYTEVHCVSPDELAREVIYRNTQGQVIATKVLDYEAGALTPSYVQRELQQEVQRDVQASDSVAVEVEQDSIIVTSTTGDKEPESAALQPHDETPVVVDAGFDAFVKENWDSLVAGEVRRFQFPVVAREALVELSIESSRCSYDTDTDQCFRLELDNWLLRMVADHIELGYDPSSQRLARFRGVSNIGDGSGQGQVVDIHYNYDNLAALQCEWR